MSIDIMSAEPAVRFVIEAVIHNDIGSVPMYVTDNGLKKPLTVSAQLPPQDWKATKYGPDKGVNLITPYTSPETHGFSWDGEVPAPGAPVIIDKAKPFTLTCLSAKPGLYWYQPGTDVGSELYVGRDPQSEELRIYSYPAGTPPEKKPIWQCSFAK